MKTAVQIIDKYESLTKNLTSKQFQDIQLAMEEYAQQFQNPIRENYPDINQPFYGNSGAKPEYDEVYLNECIEKAKPNLSKIKNVDEALDEIRGNEFIDVSDEDIEKWATEFAANADMLYEKEIAIAGAKWYRSQQHIKLRDELIKLTDYLTNKDFSYATCYGGEKRFAKTYEDFTTEQVIDEYLKTR